MQYVKPKRLGELLPKLFRDPIIVAKIAEASLPEVWAKVAGDVAARYTTEVSFRRGVMTVCISSSVLRHELLMNRKSLVHKLNEFVKAQVITDIVFR